MYNAAMNARPKRGGGTKERRSRDAGRSREAILVAAEAIFAERGYDGAGLADIAASAGLARATPTYFFGSKRALYEAVLARATSAREQALHEAFEPVRAWAEESGGRAELRGALLQAIGRYLAFLDANPSFARLIGWEAQSGAHGLAGGGVQTAAVTEALGALHAVRHERGLADFEPGLVSVALVSMCFLPVAHGATFRAGGGIDTSAPAFRRAYADVVADAIMGLLATGRSSS
jgi:TetR/AcrR family transcriptional regulator